LKKRFYTFSLTLIVITMMFFVAACASVPERKNADNTTTAATTENETVSSPDEIMSENALPSATDSESDSDITFTPDENELEIMVNSQATDSVQNPDTPVENSQPENTQNSQVITEPTFPFEEEIELPFVPV